MNASNLPVAKAEMEQAVAAAIDAWTGSDCSKFRPFFAGWTDQEPLARDGKNTITWVNDWAKRGFESTSPGNTDLQYHGHNDRWEIAEADIYLDASGYNWTTAAEQDTSVQAVLTHELGHALGLLHSCEPGGADGAPNCDAASSDVKATTMYPFYSAAQASPEADDIAGLCYLYQIGNECSDCGPHDACVDGECLATCGERTCQKGEVCGAWGCVANGSCALRDCVDQPCEGEGSCGPLAECRKGVCLRGKAKLGDPCKANPDCSEGACLGSVCQPDCQSDSECVPYGMCLTSDDGEARACISSGAYPDGATCSAGEDCKSSICIFTEQHHTCTSECESSDSCAPEWSCKHVDGRKVCVPPTISPGGGCSLTTSGGASSSLTWMFVAAALLTTRKRSKRNDT